MIQIINYHKELKLGSDETKAKDRDLRILSLGAGVQSSVLLLKILQEEIEPVDYAIFADTGNEPEKVYKWLHYLEDLVADKIEIIRVKNNDNNGDIVEDILSESGRFASIPIYTKNPDGSEGMTRRTCTFEYKIKPIQRKVREILGVNNLRGKHIEMVMGISFDEIQRVTAPSTKWQVNCYPFVEEKITRHQCHEWMINNGYKEAPRSACIICPYHSNKEWDKMKRNNPNEFKIAVAFDEELRKSNTSQFVNKLDGEIYLHRSLIPLKDINFKQHENPQYSLFDDECSGMCGV